MTTTALDTQYITKVLTDWYKINKPGTKSTTIKSYVSSIKNLNALLCNNNSYDVERFMDCDKVVDHLKNKNYKNETIRKYINSVVALLKSVSASSSCIDKYVASLTTLNEARKTSLVSRKVEVKEFKFSEDIKNKLKKRFIRRVSRGLKDDKHKAHAKNYVIFSLYTIHAPLRSEYADMIIVDEYVDSMDQSYNYMDIKNKLFVICAHKSIKKHGVVKVTIDQSLYDIIVKYRPVYYDGPNNSGPLLVNNDGCRMTHDSLCKAIKKIFKVGPAELRRYEVSRVLQEFIELEKKSEELAKRMLHTPIIQKQYYLHKTTPEQ